jgi:hypothetical protein
MGAGRRTERIGGGWRARSPETSSEVSAAAGSLTGPSLEPAASGSAPFIASPGPLEVCRTFDRALRPVPAGLAAVPGSRRGAAIDARCLVVFYFFPIFYLFRISCVLPGVEEHPNKVTICCVPQCRSNSIRTLCNEVVRGSASSPRARSAHSPARPRMSLLSANK